MAKFVTKTITSVSGRLIFKQLIVLDDNADIEKIQSAIDILEKERKDVEIEGQLDNYEHSLEDKYYSSFVRIIGNMNRVSNFQSLPKEKFKDVTPRKNNVTEYEFKYGDLRVWAIKIPNGKLVILGGYKNDQKHGFRKFRSLKEQYLKQLLK